MTQKYEKNKNQEIKLTILILEMKKERRNNRLI